MKNGTDISTKQKNKKLWCVVETSIGGHLNIEQKKNISTFRSMLSYVKRLFSVRSIY